MEKQEKRPNSKLRRERELRGWSQRAVAERVGTSEQVVVRWESGQHKPNRYFQTALCNLFGKNAEELGFMEIQTTHEVKEEQSTASKIPQELPSSFNVASLNEQSALALTSSAQPPGDIMTSRQDRGGQDMNPSRRKFFLDSFGVASVPFLPEGVYLDWETLERLARALQPSSQLEEATVDRLEAVTRDRCYEYVRSGGRMWYDIFQEMSGHLRVITQLLEKYHQSPRLRALAGETGLLLGEMLYNAGQSNAAERYYQAALEACRGEALLQAVILGRQAFIPINGGRPEKALPLLDEALQVVPTTAADLIVSWLWAVSGLAYANLGNDADCSQALNQAQRLLEHERTGEVVLRFQPEIAFEFFSPAVFSGYQGLCLLRLKRSEAAQESLGKELAYCAEKQELVHNKSIVLTDLSLSFVQQAAIRQAYQYATGALHCVEQTRSVRVFQRVLKVRQELNPWENTVYVKNLDEQIRGVAQHLKQGAK